MCKHLFFSQLFNFFGGGTGAALTFQLRLHLITAGSGNTGWHLTMCRWCQWMKRWWWMSPVVWQCSGVLMSLLRESSPFHLLHLQAARYTLAYFCLLSILHTVVDPDPHGPGSSKIWIKEQINKNVISLWLLDFVYCWTVVWNRKWQIVDRFFFIIEFKMVLFKISKYNKIKRVGSGNLAWIRIRNSENSELDPDPE